MNQGVPKDERLTALAKCCPSCRSVQVKLVKKGAASEYRCRKCGQWFHIERRAK